MALSMNACQFAANAFGVSRGLAKSSVMERFSGTATGKIGFPKPRPGRFLGTCSRLGFPETTWGTWERSGRGAVLRAGDYADDRQDRALPGLRHC
jgi:hypothetical protein